jgi:hypothetical protein
MLGTLWQAVIFAQWMIFLFAVLVIGLPYALSWLLTEPTVKLWRRLKLITRRIERWVRHHRLRQ